MASSAAAVGKTDLNDLIKSMSPLLDAETYAFAQVAADSTQLQRIAELKVKMLFRENEAWTLIVPRSIADAEGLDYIFPCRQITLNVHSSLDAVGFLAAVTTRLVETVNIGINPVSGYYHDHLFVPIGKEDDVMAQLEEMAAE